MQGNKDIPSSVPGYNPNLPPPSAGNNYAGNQFSAGAAVFPLNVQYSAGNNQYAPPRDGNLQQQFSGQSNFPMQNTSGYPNASNYPFNFQTGSPLFPITSRPPPSTPSPTVNNPFNYTMNVPPPRSIGPSGNFLPSLNVPPPPPHVSVNYNQNVGSYHQMPSNFSQFQQNTPISAGSSPQTVSHASFPSYNPYNVNSSSGMNRNSTYRKSLPGNSRTNTLSTNTYPPVSFAAPPPPIPQNQQPLLVPPPQLDKPPPNYTPHTPSQSNQSFERFRGSSSKYKFDKPPPSSDASSTGSENSRHFSRPYQKPQSGFRKRSPSEPSLSNPPNHVRSSPVGDYYDSSNKQALQKSQKRSDHSNVSRQFSSRMEKYSSSASHSKEKKPETERDRLLKDWRSHFCATSEEISKKLAELANYEEKESWIRSSPADLYYKRTGNGDEVESTQRLEALITLFEEELVNRAKKTIENQEPYNPPPRRRKKRLCKHKSEKCSSSSDSSEEEDEPEEDCSMEELSRKIQHPYRLHADLWHNEAGEMNDGPLCRCSAKSRRTGIRHGIYPGEKGFPKCKQNSNNSGKLYHYRITISPPTNFLTRTPTLIKHDQHEFLFEGFSLLSHTPIGELPTCKVIRFNIEYTILYVEEKMPENFTIRELDLFYEYLFHEILELVDFSILPTNFSTNGCSCFHFLPRFVRDLENNGKEVLAMSEVLRYLLDSSGPLVDKETLKRMMDISQNEWQDYVDYIKGMVVTNPGQRPCSVRVDQLDRNVCDLPECIDTEEEGIIHPVIVHFGIRPPQLSYAGNTEYQKAWREYVKFRHLIANMPKPSYEDKRKLEAKEMRLQEMRSIGRMKRNVTVAVSSKAFYRTGVMCDIVQHAMLIPVLAGHLRFHQSLNHLEDAIDYKFNNRYLLQLALTHPSYKENFGTNPDHARNSLTNCGIRQPEYGDRKIHYMNIRKRGINTLINIMSRFGKEYETDSNITHNERLEFLGDAVVEFLSSIHLFFMFPDLEEGGLATYRAAIVQNQHLAVLAKKLHLEEYMLYAHGSDLCHELELRHAMANCFEALMGALLLDGGITVADKVFANALFMDDESLKNVWENYPPHPLQEQEPLGDRQWIESYQMLQSLVKFEDSIGVRFKHIRLLARAFTDRSIGYTHLTLGSNQRLEFLGDTVLQLICSEYLYRHFPEHHEGHLSLLRSSLVNNRTQAVVCDDLGMTKYAVYSNPKAELKMKDRADLLEAFLGALYVDKGLEYCETFCHVCLFPRLQIFIMNQDWNDPKSKLQQCCLTLRTMDGGEPDIPIYKVIESMGPTNTRVYTVAVYFRGKRLASATGHSIQQAEMNAAKRALENSHELFPQLDHQKRIIAQSIKRQKKKTTLELKSGDGSEDTESGSKTKSEEGNSTELTKRARNAITDSDDSNLPRQYRMRDDSSVDEEDTEKNIDSNKSEADDDNSCTDQNKEKTKKRHRRRHKKKKHKKKHHSSCPKEETDALSKKSNNDEDDRNSHSHRNKKSTNQELSSSSLESEIGHNSKTIYTSDLDDPPDNNKEQKNIKHSLQLPGTEELSSSSEIESGEII